jgi:hypothetical protein
MNNPSSPEIYKDERQAFEPVARRYRMYARVATGFVLGPFLIGWFAARLGHGRASWLGWLLVAGFALCFVTMLLAPRLRCPACHANVGGKHQHYCPECGGFPIQRDQWGQQRCTVCRKRFRRRKNFHRVRYCTQCRAYLDEKGRYPWEF